MSDDHQADSGIDEADPCFHAGAGATIDAPGGVPTENACSNCGQPSSPDTWCPGCGFYAAIGACVDLAEWEQESEGAPYVDESEEPIAVWQGIPIWAWQLAGGLLFIVGVTLAGHFVTAESIAMRTQWAIVQSVLGVFAFLVAHIRFAITALSRDKELGICDVIASPVKIWIEAITDFPRTFRLMAIGTGGGVATLLAHAVLGIPYSDMINLDPPPKKKTTSPLAAVAKLAPGGNGRDMTLEEAMEELAEGAGANELGKDAEEEEDEDEEDTVVREVDCLVIGYIPTGTTPQRVRSLVVAVKMNTQWRVIGTVRVDAEVISQSALVGKVEQLRTDKPTIECNYAAVWLKPKMRCRIEVKFKEGDSKPTNMKLLRVF